MLLIIANTSDELLRNVNINDLEPQNRAYSEFFTISGCDTHFKSKLHHNDEINQDNLRMKFSASNVDFSSPCPDPVSSRRLGHVGVEEENFPKKQLFRSIRCWLV